MNSKDGTTATVGLHRVEDLKGVRFVTTKGGSRRAFALRCDWRWMPVPVADAELAVATGALPVLEQLV